MKKLLFWVGLLLIVQASIVALMRSGPRFIDPQEPWQYSLAGLRVFEIETRQSLESQFGSLFGGLGMWLLCLYLKIRQTDREIIDLRGQLLRQSLTAPPTPAEAPVSQQP